MLTVIPRIRIPVVPVLLVVALLGAADAARAQPGGIIVGTVMDDQGAVLPGVSLTLRNADTGVTRNATSEPDGGYRFPALPPGTYELKVELQGFTTVDVKNLTLTLGRELRQDIKMQIETLQETVTVTGAAPVVETTKSEVAAVVTQQQIESLPVNSRQALGLALLLPGTSQDGVRPRKVNATVGAGGTFYASAFLVDGVTNQEVKAGEPRQDFPQAAIREFKVNVSQATAEYGGSTGGVVTIATKSGTNVWSGELFEFFRDKSLNAMNLIEKQQAAERGIPKPEFQRHQYGGSLGGPIVKDRVHFYVAIDRTKQDEYITVNTGRPQFYSAVEGSFLNDQFRNLFFGRVDAQVNPQQTVFARYAWERDHVTCEGCGGTASATSGSAVQQPRSTLALGHTWVASSRALNEFRFQWAPFSFLTTVPGTPFWPPSRQGEFPDERFKHQTAIFNFPSLTYGSSAAGVQNETWWEFRNDFTFSTGNHTWKTGVAYLNVPTPEDAIGNPQGTWTFATDQVFDPGNPATLANLRNPILFTASFPPLARELPNEWFQAYIQNEWKPRSNLTLSLGLRYDLQMNAFNQKLDMSLFPRPIPFINPSTRRDTNNIGPRFGFAWDLKDNGASVVRGGYGRYYRYLFSALFAGEITNLRQANIRITNPSYPDPYQGLDPLRFVSTAPANIQIIRDDVRNPEANAYNVGLSHQLMPNLAVHMDAIYTHTKYDALLVNINTPDPVTRLRPLPEWGRILQAQPVGESKYRALFVRLDKRLTNRNQFLLSYTLSKTENNLGFSGTVTTASITSALDPGLDWGPANTDRRHAFVASGAVLLPFDVTFGALWGVRSTMPFSARAGRDLDADGAPNDFVPGTSRNEGNRGLDLSLVNAWRAANGLRAISEDQIDSNQYNSLDIRASKSIPLGGRRRLELIGQVFNVLGTDNLLPPGSGAWVDNALSDAFGRILTAQNRQQAELAVRFLF